MGTPTPEARPARGHVSRDRPRGGPGTGFRPELEGVRAVAILLVVGYHARIPGFAGGYVGVDVFFVLSGYLISSLLLKERERTGTIDLAAFYARRVRRLLPALAVMLLAVSGAAALIYSPLEHRVLSVTAAATSGYASNVYFAWKSADYLGAGAEHNPLLHTWSLSVEEQFYLLWPVLILAIVGRHSPRSAFGRRRLLTLMGCLVAASFALCLLLTDVRQAWAFFLSPPRAWEFGAGALGAIAPGRTGGFTHAFASRPRLVEAAGVVGLLGIAGAGMLFGAQTRFPGMAVLVPVLGTALLIPAILGSPRTALSRLLRCGPLQHIGRLSYSWYLWHWPVLVLSAQLDDSLRLPARIALVLLSLGLAWLSYHWVENPIRHHPRLGARPALSLGMAASLTALALTSSLLWGRVSRSLLGTPEHARYALAQREIPAMYPACDTRIYSSVPKDCTFGDPAGEETVVLLGDSHAGQWFPGLNPAVAGQGRRLVVFTKSACTPMDVSVYYHRIGRVYHECDEWRRAVYARIAVLRPRTIIVGSYAHYVSAASRRMLTEPEWVQGTTRMLNSLTGSGASVVLLRDTPELPFNGPVCLSRRAWRPHWLPRPLCRFNPADSSASRIYQGQRRAAAGFSGVWTVDMTPFICPRSLCEADQARGVVYRDGGHLAVRFTAGLSDILADRIGSVPDGAAAEQGAVTEP
ncbi:MAG TPA: acyltransferase family protein [Longimicrobium sp.]|nr:acyltransferase family protein [Longimicrobium sp.]